VFSQFRLTLPWRLPIIIVYIQLLKILEGHWKKKDDLEGPHIFVASKVVGFLKIVFVCSFY
jgi:hypothetical protein